jgi:protein-tyrosine phosphatase
MAEALFRSKLMRDYPHLLAFVEAYSCGTAAIEGNPATYSAVQAMDLWEIDIEPHRASPMTPQQLRQANLVLALSREHLLSISRSHDKAVPKATTLKYLASVAGAITGRLGEETVEDEESARNRIDEVLRLLDELSPEEDYTADLTARGSDIIDPIGSSLQVYIGVAEEIDAALEAVMRALFGRPLRDADGEDSPS